MAAADKSGAPISSGVPAASAPVSCRGRRFLGAGDHAGPTRRGHRSPRDHARRTSSNCARRRWTWRKKRALAGRKNRAGAARAGSGRIVVRPVLDVAARADKLAQDLAAARRQNQAIAGQLADAQAALQAERRAPPRRSRRRRIRRSPNCERNSSPCGATSPKRQADGDAAAKQVSDLTGRNWRRLRATSRAQLSPALPPARPASPTELQARLTATLSG